jgi:hypothetical protein
MDTVNARNVNDAYMRGMSLLQRFGHEQSSRGGPVISIDRPVATRYDYPAERVLWSPQRDANPFFHLFEALWMLEGRNDIETMMYFLPKFREYSDDGVTLYGAYGKRWRRYPTTYSTTVDQLPTAIRMLRENPNDRRVVITMWNIHDLGRVSKDIPCNDMIKLRIIQGALHMYVFNRSNDAIWGAYGANAVHMSFLQEYLAAHIGCELGAYEQISTDFHAYLDVWNKQWPMQAYVDLYNGAQPPLIHPLVTHPAHFDLDLHTFFAHWNEIKRGQFNLDSRNFFFNVIAAPMLCAFSLYRDDHEPLLGAAYLENHIHKFGRYDWFLAGHEWLMRRAQKQKPKEPPATMQITF